MGEIQLVKDGKINAYLNSLIEGFQKLDDAEDPNGVLASLNDALADLDSEVWVVIEDYESEGML